MNAANLGILAGMWVVALALLYIRLYRHGQIRSWLHAGLVMLYIPSLMVFSAWDAVDFAPLKFMFQFIIFICIFISASFGFQPPQVPTRNTSK